MWKLYTARINALSSNEFRDIINYDFIKGDQV